MNKADASSTKEKVKPKLTGKDATQKSIDEAITEYIGILGYSKSAQKVVKRGKGFIILTINREMLNNVQASFVISKKDIKVVKVSGTLKGLGFSGK